MLLGPQILSLTLCMLGNFSCVCCRLLLFFSLKLTLKNLSGSNGLDPDQDRNSVGPDLGTNCFQRLSTVDKSGR